MFNDLVYFIGLLSLCELPLYEYTAVLPKVRAASFKGAMKPISGAAKIMGQ
jgi:hypothetical protein